MARWLGLALILEIVLASGCAMCCAPYDDHYPYVGGRWVRDNPAHGRVGSAFDPAGHRVEDGVVGEEEPTPAEPPSLAPGSRSAGPRPDGMNYLPTEE